MPKDMIFLIFKYYMNWLTCKRVGTASVRPADFTERLQQLESRPWHSQQHVNVWIQRKMNA